MLTRMAPLSAAREGVGGGMQLHEKPNRLLSVNQPLTVTAYVPDFGLFFRPELNLRATIAKPSGLHG